MNNKKRNTIIIVVVLILILIVLCIWGVSCGKSKGIDVTKTSGGIEVTETGEQQLLDSKAKERASNTDAQNAQDVADEDPEKTDRDSNQSEDDETADAKNEAGINQNEKSGSGVKKSNKAGSSSVLGRKIGNSATDLQGADAADDEDEGKVIISTEKAQILSGSYATPPKLYIPPTEDINLSDEIETDENGAIVFPFVSYE